MNWPGWKLALARSVHILFGNTGEIMENPFAKKTLQTDIQVSEEVKPESLDLQEADKNLVEDQHEVITFNATILDVSPERKMSSGMDSAKNRILQQYGGNESDVPINSPYWTMK